MLVTKVDTKTLQWDRQHKQKYQSQTEI